MERAEAEASSYWQATSNTQPNNQNEILEQLNPALVVMQQTKQ